MPRILTIDDSRAVRSIVSKQVKELGFDVDEAEDGQQGLDRLAEVACDLILLDVTMPVMDGPTMLTKLRERGDQTPVIMLTSESKRSIMVEAMKQGISDYILKPFKPDELMGKIHAALKMPGPAKGGPIASTPASAPARPEVAAVLAQGHQFIDVMVVDDMENVAKRLRALLPEHLTLSGFTSAQAALAAARETVCRVILVDYDLPDIDSAALAGQCKALQPHAALVAMMLKTNNDVAKETRERGFDSVLFKPFATEAIADFAMQYFDKQELLVREDNLLRINAFAGRKDRVEGYFSRLVTLIDPALENVAAACFEDAIVDLSKAAIVEERTPKLLVSVAAKAKEVGLNVRLVGSPELRKLLSVFEETRSLPLFLTVGEARADAA